jgi:hypothetical protein
MTNAATLIEGLVAVGTDICGDALVMVAAKPTMPILTLKQELTMSMGHSIVRTTLSNDNGRTLYTARDTDPSTFGKAISSFEAFSYSASKHALAEAAKLTNELVDVFGYLEETEADPYQK